MVVDTPIIVTESSRIHLWRLVYFLGWAEAAAGVALIVLVSYPIATLTRHLPAHELLLHNVYYAQLFIGVTVTIASIDGILVNRACLYNPFLVSTKTAFKIWFIVGICLTCLTIVSIIVIPTAIEKSGEELIELLHWGSRYYMTDLSWKQSFDSIHQDFKCCGVYSVNDWLANRWIPLELFRPEIVDLQDSVLEDGSLTVRVVPASCCDPELRIECFHDYLQQNRSNLRPELVMAETVFTRGCGQLLLDSVQWVTPPFMALTSVIVTFKIGQLVIGRCLYNLTHRLEISEKKESSEIELSDRELSTSEAISHALPNEAQFSLTSNAVSSRSNIEQFVSFETFDDAKDEIPVYAVQIENSTEIETGESTSSTSPRSVQCKALLRPARTVAVAQHRQSTQAMTLPGVRITPETMMDRAAAVAVAQPIQACHRHSRDCGDQQSTSEMPVTVPESEDGTVRARRRVNSSKYEYDLLQPVDFSMLF